MADREGKKRNFSLGSHRGMMETQPREREPKPRKKTEFLQVCRDKNENGSRDRVSRSGRDSDLHAIRR